MLIQLADYWNELLREMCVNSARLFSPLKVYHAKNWKNKLFGCRFVPKAWAIWLYHSIRIRPSDPREYAQTLLDWNLNFISILNCGIDILSVSDPDLEIKGSGGGRGGGVITTQRKKLVLHLAWFIVHVLIAQWLLYFVCPRQKGIFSGLKAWNGLNKSMT